MKSDEHLKDHPGTPSSWSHEMFDVDEAWIEEHIALLRREGHPILFGGRVIEWKDIQLILIIYTDKTFKQLQLERVSGSAIFSPPGQLFNKKDAKSTRPAPAGWTRHAFPTGTTSQQTPLRLSNPARTTPARLAAPHVRQVAFLLHRSRLRVRGAGDGLSCGLDLVTTGRRGGSRR
jgi:hypothetical protein